MSQTNAFPLVAFDLIPDVEGDMAMASWGHYLGACARPFGLQTWGLSVRGFGLVSVAISASTVSKTCAGHDRQELVELARLCSHPDHRWATRVCLRLWREVGSRAWPYWLPRAAVSYADSTRHAGDIYRFDGWTKVADTKGSTGGGQWSSPKERTPKSLWRYSLPSPQPAGGQG